MKNNPPTPSIKPPTSCCHQVVQKPKPYLKSFKQLRPKIHQPKNYPISITKSTFEPLKASFTITQSPESQLNKIDSGAKEKKKKEKWRTTKNSQENEKSNLRIESGIDDMEPVVMGGAGEKRASDGWCRKGWSR